MTYECSDMGGLGEQAPGVVGAASDATGTATDLVESVQLSVGDTLGSVGRFFNSIVNSVTSAKDQV